MDTVSLARCRLLSVGQRLAVLGAGRWGKVEGGLQVALANEVSHVDLTSPLELSPHKPDHQVGWDPERLLLSLSHPHSCQSPPLWRASLKT